MSYSHAPSRVRARAQEDVLRSTVPALGLGLRCVGLAAYSYCPYAPASSQADWYAEEFELCYAQVCAVSVHLGTLL